MNSRVIVDQLDLAQCVPAKTLGHVTSRVYRTWCTLSAVALCALCNVDSSQCNLQPDKTFPYPATQHLTQ